MFNTPRLGQTDQLETCTEKLHPWRRDSTDGGIVGNTICNTNIDSAVTPTGKRLPICITPWNAVKQGCAMSVTIATRWCISIPLAHSRGCHASCSSERQNKTSQRGHNWCVRGAPTASCSSEGKTKHRKEAITLRKKRGKRTTQLFLCD